MAKPAIIAVDDDPQVLRAVEGDLRRRYSDDYRVVAASSGAEGLEVLEQLKLRDDEVALFVVDQRMPRMTGVEFLERAEALFPRAKRTLLTAYADTEAAIQAINRANLDYYILKPWDPPEDKLYPILDDLLDDWLAGYRPPFEGVRVIEHRWSPRSHDLKAFLARNQVPYISLDAASDEEAQRLLAYAGVGPSDLPVVLLPDGATLVQPTDAEVAERIGLRTHAERPFYDLVVVGAGPSGLAAAVYGASEGLRTLVVEREAPGGQAGQSARIENYLGFPVGLSGADLARRAATQAQRFGAELLVPQEAVALQRKDPYRVVQLSDGSDVSCHALIVATGVSYRKLPAPGVDEVTGAGVYYGASRVEAVAHQGEDVLVVGGGNSAGQAAVFLSGFARTVTVMVRDASLTATMSQYLIDTLDGIENVTVRSRSQVVEAQSEDGRLSALVVEDLDRGSREPVEVGAMFVFIGQEPRTAWLDGVVARDDHGFVLSGADCGPSPRGWTLDRTPFPLETSVSGVFAAGDVRHGSTKRVASATGEGAMAVSFVHQHLAGL